MLWSSPVFASVLSVAFCWDVVEDVTLVFATFCTEDLADEIVVARFCVPTSFCTVVVCGISPTAFLFGITASTFTTGVVSLR